MTSFSSGTSMKVRKNLNTAHFSLELRKRKENNLEKSQKKDIDLIKIVYLYVNFLIGINDRWSRFIVDMEYFLHI